jgi:hypothetical protein
MIGWGGLIGPRRIGKTHHMAEAAKRLGAVLVCRDEAEARRVAKEYGIRTFSVRWPAGNLRGFGLPVFFDPDAVELMAGHYEHQLELERNRVDRMDKETEELREAYRRELASNGRLREVLASTEAQLVSIIAERERLRSVVLRLAISNDEMRGRLAVVEGMLAGVNASTPTTSKEMNAGVVPGIGG